jgi:hypothetical protein
MCPVQCVTYVSGTMCYLCLRPLTDETLLGRTPMADSVHSRNYDRGIIGLASSRKLIKRRKDRVY